MLSGAGQALNYAFVGVFFVWLWFPVLRAFYSGMGMANGRRHVDGHPDFLQRLARSWATGVQRQKRRQKRRLHQLPCHNRGAVATPHHGSAGPSLSTARRTAFTSPASLLWEAGSG